MFIIIIIIIKFTWSKVFQRKTTGIVFNYLSIVKNTSLLSASDDVPVNQEGTVAYIQILLLLWSMRFKIKWIMPALPRNIY